MNRKPIFDTLRRILGRPLRQGEVARLDGALDISHQDSAPCAPGYDETHDTPRRISPRGIALIKQFEGCAKLRRDGRVEAYPDPGTGGDPWTIGWGATGVGIGPGTVWTRDACDARLEADLERYADDVARALGDARTSQAQFDALVSFHYNTGAIAKATLTRKHRIGDFAGAAREFDRWCYAGGRVMRGLARRRTAEAKLYRSADG
ncbi:lysozyme [Aurantiacibacter gangjinensis]|uniref:Lysozyme n=1 Tax=Aurantiacibacter gangjinensis TaxID=502682 RepID=A0A0G9MRV5_9SPHN|nr:lysozyme [Aurantiacibacter gangjinensis]APE27041.1 Phage-related lysozyme (muraminidase) [Aurantiacibacter gangjinensis]KLE33476.1 glycoside hydrolase [Aurantiacibacter gangjinensis]